MDSFDKKISKLYKGDEKSTELPEGFSWEEMSDGIYEKMKEPEKKRKFFWMWFTTIGSLLLLTLLFFLFQTDSNEINTPIAIKDTKEVNSAKESTNIISDENPIEKNPVFTEKNQENDSQNSTSNSIANNQTDNESTIKNNNAPTLLKKNLKTNASYLEEEKSGSPDSMTIASQSNNSTIEENKVISEIESIVEVKPVAKMDSSESNQPNLTSESLARLPIPKNYLTAKPLVNSLVIAVSKNTKKEPKQNLNDKKQKSKEKIKLASTFAPQIYGGTLFTSGKHRQNQQRNQYSKWLPGYYVGLEATVLGYKKWKINLGYEHKFAVQEFNFRNITDTTSTIVEDVVTGIRTNSLNGSSSETRETISTQALRTRNYLHYNTFRSHAVRITLTRDFQLSKKLSFIAGLGGSYNFHHRTLGRTIGKDSNILNYDSNNSIYRKHYFGIDGGFSIAYQIGKIQLRGNCWLEKTLDYTVEPVENIRPVFYKIGLGMMYSFQ